MVFFIVQTMDQWWQRELLKKASPMTTQSWFDSWSNIDMMQSKYYGHHKIGGTRGSCARLLVKRSVFCCSSPVRFCWKNPNHYRLEYSTAGIFRTKNKATAFPCGLLAHILWKVFKSWVLCSKSQTTGMEQREHSLTSTSAKFHYLEVVFILLIF